MNTAEDGAEEYAHVVVGASRYEAVHDGVDWIVSRCPECDRETLVDGGHTGGTQPGVRWVCFSCGEQWREAALWSCDICGAWILAGEGEMTVCGDCFSWRVNSSD